MNYRAWVMGAMLLGLIGCKDLLMPSRAPEEREKDAEAKAISDVKVIGEVTTVSNADPQPVSGVGLVVGLEGTGGDPPRGGYLTFLEDQLRKKNVANIRELLTSPNNSLVLVSAMIPAGAHKEDALDVEISLPPGSRTTSLRGGYLKECALYNYESTKNLSPNYQGANSTLIGHVLAWAEGPLVVGFGDGDEAARVKQGRIWGGGHSKIDRPFYLVFNDDQQRAPLVQRVAERINETFHGPYHGLGGDLAVAETKTYCILRVPVQYKLNLPRYLRVVRLIPLSGAPAAHSPYRHTLEEQLLDPAHTVTAALRLEALGPDSIPTLKQGLQSTHPLVRFTCAEALAYLGSPACGEELAKLIESQPMLRAYCLTAMASLDEAVCHVKLRDLLASPSAETRYGAFRALRALDEREPAVRGEFLNQSFHLYRAAPDSRGLVHMSSSRRAEVVLFGEEPFLVPPFSFLAGEFTVTAAAHDTRCTLSRLSVRKGTLRRQCSLKLDEVLHNMADMGGTYPEVVELLRDAGKYQALTCPVAVDALPQAPTVEELAQDGGKGQILAADDELLKAQDDFGATPTLYDKSRARRQPN
jgi:hypothetical protein